MPECSLCGGPVDPEGGAVLFTDYRGIPFEVCEKCEGYIGMLRNSSGEEEINRALDYISCCAENIENRGVYDSLMRFIEDELPASRRRQEEGSGEEVEQEGIDVEDAGVESMEETARKTAGGEKKTGGFLFVALGTILIAILIILFVFGGIRF